ncbi:MAG TPA: ATP-grasp domain-containing protein [Chloroflexota bacterium]|nr:ATP-grasp domain-containing protein [Chloroflexota bacterium]
MARVAPAASHPPLATRAPGALVIGGDYQGLGIVRSLGRRGIPVWVLDDERSIAAVSRYTRRRLPWPTANPQAQRDYLLALGARYGLAGWVIFPTRDETVALLAREHAALSRCFRLATPPWPVTRWAYDKRLTYHLAAKSGVDYPRTYQPPSAAAVATLDCPFPALLKPAIKEPFYRQTHAKAWRVDDRATLLARYAEACALIAPEEVLVQELIPGGGEAQFSYAALCLAGRPLASLVARRVRQHPMDFGHASTYVETVEEPAVEAAAQRLLAAMGYTGLVEVEFKRDPRDGRFKLLDVNARTWGWHTLGRRAGVDFPFLLWRLLHGEPPPPSRARPGVRWMRLLTDLPTAAGEIARGRLAPRAYLRSLVGDREGAVFAWDDPLPALLELALVPYLWRKRGF